jgi:hypothetical protein
VFGSLFKQPLGDDATWRIDVPARGQLLGMLRLLLFIYSEGVTNDAALALYFVFSSSLDGVEQDLHANSEEDNDGDDSNGLDNIVLQAFVEEGGDEDFLPEGEKREKPTSARFLAACQRAFQHIPPSEVELTIAGGKRLREELMRVIPEAVLQPATASAAEPFTKVLRKRGQTERVVKIEEAPHNRNEGNTAWDRFTRFKELSSFGAASPPVGQANRNAPLRQKDGNLASVRACVFELLMVQLETSDNTEKHPGFRLSPLPRQAVQMPLQNSMFYTSGKDHNGKKEGFAGIAQVAGVTAIGI